MKIKRSTSQALAQSSAQDPAQSLAGSQFALPEGISLTTLQNSKGLLPSIWRWIRKQQAARSSNKRLQVSATASLGEKRFVAVVQVDGMEFLVGGGPTNVALLAQLSAKVRFGDVLKESMNGGVRTQSADRARIQAGRPTVDQAREQD
jgi:hypothetical protein